MSLRLKKKLSGIQIQYADSDQLIASRGYMILRSTNNGAAWSRIGSTAKRVLDKLFSRLTLYTRATRRKIHHLYPILDGKWLVVGKQEFLILDGGEGTTRFPLPGHGSRPLRDAVAVQGKDVIFGEYFSNPDREKVAVYQAGPGGSRPLYTFLPGQIRHIHALQYDPFWERYWIGTGDEDAECLVGVFDRNFKDLEVLGGGTQNWRTVSFAFTPEAVFWGTDIPEGENRVFRLDRKSTVVEPVFEVQGPVYYTKVVNGKILFGTTAEDNFSYGGLGRIYLYDPTADSASAVWQDRKDWLPSHLFGYGIYEFPRGSLEGDSFWVTCRGFQGGIRSLLFEITDE